MNGNQIRKSFLDYFAERGHRVVKSSPTVPANDATLLFTNAGMNQFKDVFLGLEQRDYKRAASSQKCMRAGGKHNDLENVGRTRRHHTFFEMLGNFSFGDYFKEDAIKFAWELITGVYAIPADKLTLTVFREDSDALNLWAKISGKPTSAIFRLDEKDNFWSMGDTGPCGPCSEIHYDLGAHASDWGHTDCVFPCDCGRYVEIWNLVFMQFNRDANGKMTPLPKPSIDTGMGLERLASILQGKLSNFETDLLWPLILESEEMAGVEYGEKPESDTSLRILADHARAATFLIHDGVLPANDGRGYVLRKVLRRAARHGGQLGMNEPFLYKLTGKVAEMMSEPYPELLESADRVAMVVKAEELRFAHTMTVALTEFEKVLKSLPANYQSPALQLAKQEGHGPIAEFPGDKAFQLYDTFGMPLDWINELASERNLRVNEIEFEQAMQRQRERARASWKGAEKGVLSPVFSEILKQGQTVFEGYERNESPNCKVVALLQDGKSVHEIPAGCKAELVLDHTPFYAESGGQVGDAGSLVCEATGEVVASVRDTYRPVSGLIAHRIVSRSAMMLGDQVAAAVNVERRRATMRNHTATHILHAALRQVLGTHVKQAGSVVDPQRLRFDFSHFASVDQLELTEIENLANQEIQKNVAVETAVMEIDKAIEGGALAFFGEKYPDKVRVVAVPGFSKELCGGTHVSRTGEIGLLKVVSEGSISAGVRRIEAVTGTGALDQFQEVTQMIRGLAASLKTTPAELPQAVAKLADHQRTLEKQIDQLKMKLANSALTEVESKIVMVKDIKLLAFRSDGLGRPEMRNLADSLRQKLGSGMVLLASVADDKIALIAAATADLNKRVHAGKFAQAIAQKLGGTGGGRPDLAEAGGKDVIRLDTVLKEAADVLAGML
jgi:alanyl-tRNA synthetase